MLYGMGAEQAQLFAEQGHRVRIYTPFGELIPGMAYLVRRLLENTSNDSFLRAGFVENVSPDALLANPANHVGQAFLPAINITADKNVCPTRKSMAMTFTNQPPVDFSIPENR